MMFSLMTLTTLQGWHMGVSAGLDTKKNALKSHQLALGRFAPDYTVHAFLSVALPLPSPLIRW